MVWDNVNVGVVKAERNEIDKQVVVGSVQTISRENRLEQLPTTLNMRRLMIEHEARKARYAPTTTRRLFGCAVTG